MLAIKSDDPLCSMALCVLYYFAS